MYWRQQAGLAYGVVAFLSYLALFLITILAATSLRWSTFWVVIGCVFLAERLVTVWAAGWRARLLAAPIVIELGYALFLQFCFLTSLTQIGTGKKADWNYVPREVQGLVVGVGLALHDSAVFTYGIVLPESVLLTDWYEALAIWVAFNTLAYVGLSLVTLAPPRPRHKTREARAAIADTVRRLPESPQTGVTP